MRVERLERVHGQVSTDVGERLLAHAPVLLAAARSMTLDEAEAQDLVQTALEIGLRRMDQLRDPAALRPWLLTIQAREAFRSSRRLRRLVRLDRTVHELAAPGASDTERIAVRRALGQLPARKRAAVVLHHMASLSVAETAAALGTSENTVKWQLRVGLARLRTCSPMTDPRDGRILERLEHVFTAEVTDAARDLEQRPLPWPRRTLRARASIAVVTLVMAVIGSLVFASLAAGPDHGAAQTLLPVADTPSVLAAASPSPVRPSPPAVSTPSAEPPAASFPTASPAAPSPSATPAASPRLPADLPVELVSGPVLTVAEARWQLDAATDDTRLLVGGWLESPAIPCPWNPDYGPCNRYIVAMQGSASHAPPVDGLHLTFVDGLPSYLGDGAAIMRIHRHDPRVGPEDVVADEILWLLPKTLPHPAVDTLLPDGVPSAIAGEQVLRPSAALALARQRPDAAPFLVGGWFVWDNRFRSHQDCLKPSDHPLIIDECAVPNPQPGRLVRQIFDGPPGAADGWDVLGVPGGTIPQGVVVLRAHVHDPQAVSCPEAFRQRCWDAVVVDEIVWTAGSDAPAPLDIIDVEQALSEGAEFGLVLPTTATPAEHDAACDPVRPERRWRLSGEPRIRDVLVFASVAQRQDRQGHYTADGYNGERCLLTEDGFRHHRWVAFENVMVQVDADEPEYAEAIARLLKGGPLDLSYGQPPAWAVGELARATIDAFVAARAAGYLRSAVKFVRHWTQSITNPAESLAALVAAEGPETFQHDEIEELDRSLISASHLGADRWQRFDQAGIDLETTRLFRVVHGDAAPGSEEWLVAAPRNDSLTLYLVSGPELSERPTVPAP